MYAVNSSQWTVDTPVEEQKYIYTSTIGFALKWGHFYTQQPSPIFQGPYGEKDQSQYWLR